MDPFGSLGRISIPAVMGNVSYEENPCWSLLVCSSYATHEMMILSQYLCLYLYIYIHGRGGREQSRKCSVSFQVGTQRHFFDFSNIFDAGPLSIEEGYYALMWWSCLIRKSRKYELNLWLYVILLQCTYICIIWYYQYSDNKHIVTCFSIYMTVSEVTSGICIS